MKSVMPIIKTIVKWINAASLIGMMLTGLVGVSYDLLGSGKFDKVCTFLGIQNGFKLVWVFGSVMLFLFTVSHVLKNRLD